ncbi:hypothetical protein Misp01_11000 [Microtetraspora sp. NBRC 13810]|nr:hypothetical protein Misp01_11000 [Microtetraspora sp. NBRC 13810]
MLIDRYGRHALGQAYSTADPHHLLNTSADKMSALHDDPAHLLTWARGNGLDLAGSDFLPRGDYGRYLRDVLADAEDVPARVVRRVTATATGLTRPAGGHGVRVELAGGEWIDADAAVLALGNRAPAAWPQIVDADTPRYVADPWAPDALAGICDGTPVLVIGTGLTMVDIAVTVTRARPDAVVYAVSRHGLLPRRHPDPLPVPVPTPIQDGPLPLAGLLRAVRLAVRDNGGDWAGVVDGLRSHAPGLWTRLSPADQRRFLNLAARFWEVHRHRIPPVTAARIAELRDGGRLRVLRGQVIRSTAAPGGLHVHVGVDGAVQVLDVGWLVNATGPGSDIGRDPFLARLIEAGDARPDRLRLGLDAGRGGAVLDAEGRSDGRVVTLGPLLRGTLYETTAIPEIRAQAAAIAPRLIETIAAPVSVSLTAEPEF